MPLPPLFKHQVEDIKFELENPVLFDASEAGTGKTRTRLEAFAKRHSTGKSKCALVLASKSLLRSAWENDCRKFTPWLKTVCCYAPTRAKDFKQKADIYITNHDAVTWLAQQPPEFFKKFTNLIIDESTAFKHHTSARSKALNKIRNYFEYAVLMSGTMNTNNITDVWNQYFILDRGSRLGKSFYAFRNAVQVPTPIRGVPHAMKWTDKDEAADAVGSLVSDITIRHLLKDCHDIPDNHNFVVDFDLSKKLKQSYTDMKRDKIIELKKADIKAINAASVITKLLQIASGAVYDENGDYHVIDKSRYELIVDLINERKFCVVFFNWKHQRDMLLEHFKKENITHGVIDGEVSGNRRDEVVKFFQSGLYRVLLAHPQSAAHGLTLTKGTTTIWSSPTYNLEHYIQGNRRIHRAGQKEKTETINIIAKGTIEEYVYNTVLSGKQEKMDNLLEILQTLQT